VRAAFPVGELGPCNIAERALAICLLGQPDISEHELARGQLVIGARSDGVRATVEPAAV